MNASFKAIVTADISNFDKNIKKAVDITNNSVSKMQSQFDKLGDSFVKIGKKASILSAGLVAVGTKAFLMAADIEDAIGATEQIFGDNADSVNAWANKLDTSFGIAKKEALEYSNLMGSMLINIGKLTEEQASEQSAKLIELAGDLTAMYGGTTQDAVRALTGALKGNNTMLDNYGMAVNEALIKQKALELGLIGTSGEMTLQAKQGATLALIWEQTGAAQGQAAREMDGASGAMRALKTEIINLTTELGEVLLPIITPIVAGIRDFVSGIRDLSPEARKMIVVVAGIAAAVGPLLLSLGKIIKILPLIGTGFTAVTGPIGIAIAAIAGIATLIISNWDKISNYFTSGDGAKLFNSIKKLVSVAVKNVRDNFERIASIVKRIWSQIGDTVTFIWNNTFSNVVNIVSIAINVVSDILEGLAFLLEGDLKGAMNSFKNLFVGIFDGIKNVVLNSVSSIAMGLGKLLEFLKLDKWGTQMQDWAEKIKPAIKKVGVEIEETTEETKEATSAITEFSETVKGVGVALDVFEKGNLREAIANTSLELEKAKERLEGLRTGAIEVANFHEEIKKAEERVIELATALDVLTGGRDYNLDLKLPEALLEPTIKPKVEIDDKFKADLTEGISVIMVDLNNYITDGITDLMMSISDALVQGEGVMSAIGSSLLGTLGGIMVDLGKMTLMAGNAIEAVKASLVSLQGPIAIAAGVALIAIGSLFSAGARSLGRGMSGGYSGSQSMASVTPTRGDSEYRGAYRDDFKVEFEIGANKLVGVLDTANQRKNRL